MEGLSNKIRLMFPLQLRDQTFTKLDRMFSHQGGNSLKIQTFIEIYYEFLEERCMGDFNFGHNLNYLILVYDLIIYCQNISRLFDIPDTTALQKLHIRFIQNAKLFSKSLLKVRTLLHQQPFQEWLCNEQTIIPRGKSKYFKKSEIFYPLTCIKAYFVPMAPDPKLASNSNHVAHFYYKRDQLYCPELGRVVISYELLVYSSNQFSEKSFVNLILFVENNFSDAPCLNKSSQ